MEAESRDVFEIADTLLGTVGHPVFEQLGTTAGDEARVFYCRQSGADARGVYSSDGFVVISGSFVRGEMVPSIRERLEPKRQQLINEGVLEASGDGYRFTRDHAFGSPSAAAGMVAGTPVNGWDVWVDEEGNTLHDVYGTASSE